MKIKISESKIRQIVNEEYIKNSLTKTVNEQKWPSYAAYLLAEILTLEWQNNLQEGDTDSRPSAEWIAEHAAPLGLPESDVLEATALLQEEFFKGVGDFFKAAAAPIVNVHKTLSNITKHAANLTDPDAQKTAKTVDQIDDKIPDAEELTAKVKSNPDDIMALLRQILDLLQAADNKVDLDAIKPGLEDEVDDQVDDLEQAMSQAPADVEGGEDAGGGTAFVYRGKGGKGLQSFLAKGGVSGPVMGATLKHIEKQLKAQGVTVSEGILDEVQGWVWYGLVENMLQEHYNSDVTIEELLKEFDGPNRAAQKKGKTFRKAADARRAKLAGGEPAREDPAAAGAKDPAGDIEQIKPTVQNTAPEGSPVVKVFRGKGGEGLQSALARAREKLGIQQQDVSVIIKQVEEWAQANQIKVENVTAEGFDTILSEISALYQARRLQEVINKLRT